MDHIFHAGMRETRVRFGSYMPLNPQKLGQGTHAAPLQLVFHSSCQACQASKAMQPAISPPTCCPCLLSANCELPTRPTNKWPAHERSPQQKKLVHTFTPSQHWSSPPTHSHRPAHKDHTKRHTDMAQEHAHATHSTSIHTLYARTADGPRVPAAPAAAAVPASLAACAPTVARAPCV